MPSLKSVAESFQSVIVKETGQPFMGTIMPVDEGKIPYYDFSVPRLMLRTTERDIVKPRDIILDDLDQKYLVATHGHSKPGEHFSFRLFKLNADLQWTRSEVATNTLTGIKEKTANSDLGKIPCLIEMMGRQFPDNTTHISEEMRRVLTPALLQLGDQVDDAIVRRIDTALDVTYAEIS